MQLIQNYTIIIPIQNFGTWYCPLEMELPVLWVKPLLETEAVTEVCCHLKFTQGAFQKAHSISTVFWDSSIFGKCELSFHRISIFAITRKCFWVTFPLYFWNRFTLWWIWSFIFYMFSQSLWIPNYLSIVISQSDQIQLEMFPNTVYILQQWNAYTTHLFIPLYHYLCLDRGAKSVIYNSFYNWDLMHFT